MGRTGRNTAYTHEGVETDLCSPIAMPNSLGKFCIGYKILYFLPRQPIFHGLHRFM